MIKKDKDRAFIDRMTLKTVPPNNNIHIGLRQSYILPTIRGIYYIITLMIMFIWSINFNLTLGYFITFSTLVVALIIAVITTKNISNISVIPVDATYDFFAGQFAYFPLHIKSFKKQEKINLIARRNGIYSKSISLKDKECLIKVPLDKTIRGVHYLQHVQLSSDYPIGIFRSWCWLYFDYPIIVYPNPNGNLPLPIISKKQGIQEIDSLHQGNEDFTNIREYRLGDPIRQIAWKKTINEQLFIKEFNDHNDQYCSIRFDNPNIMQLNTEQKLSQLCKWIIEATKKGIPYDLVLPNKVIPEGRGEQHQTTCLRALACY